ncbi:MAG: sugar phosphate nucleotidyltransferase [Myxococcota bacterium]
MSAAQPGGAATAPGVRQAIVLAAGEGRRLRPITLTTPKPLVPFFGRPLLDWAVAKLARAGVERIAVNAWHLADQVAARVAALAAQHPAIDFHVSREPVLLGTGGAVRYLRHWLTPGEPFFVLNSDAVFAAEPSALASGLRAEPALLVTREWTYAAERRIVASTASTPSGAVPDLRWVALDEASRPDAFTFCGLTLADPGLPGRLPDGPSCILRQGFLPWLDARPVRLVETTDFFADTGSARALVDAHLRGRAWVESVYADLWPAAAPTSRGI